MRTVHKVCVLFRLLLLVPLPLLNLYPVLLSSRYPTVCILCSLSARVFLKEACGFTEFISILFMLGGITCVIKPPFIFPGEEAEKDRWDRGVCGACALAIFSFTGQVVSGVLRHTRTCYFILLSCLLWDGCASAPLSHHLLLVEPYLSLDGTIGLERSGLLTYRRNRC